MPRSRVPAWSRGALEERFGADYVWIGEFGNANWRNNAGIELLNPDAGAKRLRGLVNEGGRPPLLICACSDVAVCHRAHVAAFLQQAFGWDVEHLASAPRASRRTPPGSTPARRANHGLRKLCDCGRRQWPKCPHSWHFNYKPRGGKPWRFSLDTEAGKHIESRTDAEKLATEIRAAINAGTFVRAADRRRIAEAAPAPVTAAATSVEAFGEKFVTNKSQASGKKSWANDAYMFAQLSAFTLADGVRLGSKAIGAVTEDDLEAFMAHLRTNGRAASTRNQYVQLLKASFRWAVKKGYLARSPISDDSTLKRTKIAQRQRRLVPDKVDKNGKLIEPGEERRLLAVAARRLQWIIIAALETGCRRGELLSLQWVDVDLKAGYLRIRAEKAKDGEARVLPISGRLAAVLAMAKTDPGR